MFEEEDFEDELDFEADLEILQEAYKNAYLIITGKIDIADFIIRQTNKNKIVFLPFDPKAPETIELIIDDIIAYFEEIEEYEKCNELLKFKERITDDTE